MYRHIREKKVIGKKKYGFTNCKLCLTNLITFFIVMTGFEDEGREVVALNFGKFCLCSYSIFGAKLDRQGRWVYLLV